MTRKSEIEKKSHKKTSYSSALNLHIINDAEIIKKLDSQDSISDYLKRLIAEDMKKKTVEKKYIVRAINNSTSKVGDMLEGEYVTELVGKHGAKLEADSTLSFDTGYDYYRLYCGDGTFILLQDISNDARNPDYDN